VSGMEQTEILRQRRNHKMRRFWALFIRYLILIVVGVLMAYPLLWMVGSTFKTNNEIFSGIHIIPRNPTLDGYVNAMKSYGGDIDLWRALLNTYKIVIPKVLFTLLSATLTAYGFGRFTFKGRNFLFAVLMSTLFLPQVVLNVPQFLMYTRLGWVNSPWYAPLILPSLFATETYFVFLLIQFLRSIPRELDEAAKIDGANRWGQMIHITIPLMSSVIFFNLILGIIGSFQIFTAGYLMTNGGPQNATLFYVLYLYRQACQSLKMGYAAALSWVLFFIILFLTLIIFRTVGRRVYYQ